MSSRFPRPSSWRPGLLLFAFCALLGCANSPGSAAEPEDSPDEQETPATPKTAPAAESDTSPPLDWPESDPDQGMGFQVDAFVNSLGFHVLYRREAMPEGHIPKLEILRPDGTPYVPEKIHEGEILRGGRMEPFATRMVKIEAPEPGFWRVLVDGEDRLPNREDWDLDYSLDVKHRLTFEPRVAFTSECSPCWIFEAFLDGEIAAESLRARGSISRRVEVTDDGERFGDPWDLELRDDGNGYDRMANDGRFTSRPWSPREDEVVAAWAEMIGIAGGHPFHRRAFDDQIGDSFEVSFPYPPLKPKQSYDLIPDAAIVQAYAAQGFKITSPLGTFRLVRFTREGDAEITWPSPLDEAMAEVLLYGVEPPDRLSALNTLLLTLWGMEIPVAIRAAP